MADARVLQFMLDANRPYGAQGVADMLAQFGLKKTAVTRSLDALAASGKLTVKEFGKSRIYWAPQHADAAPDPAEAAALAAQKAHLQDALTAANARVAKLKAELATATAGPSPAEVSERLSKANAALPDLQKKVAALRGDGSAPRVSAADMAAAQKKAADAVSAWSKRRAAFKAVWDGITENMDRNPKNLLDEIGVETDEAVGVCLADVRAVVGSVGVGGNKMRKT